MSDLPAEPTNVRTRLSVMMFLQYAIWGAWLPILYPFLLGHRKWSLDQVGMILAGGAVGAIIGPFIAGQVADRYFATEKFLGISHLLGAVLVWLLASVDSFGPFLAISVFYGLIYAPTIALTNSLSFHHLPDRDRDFGKVRVWGTIGWIAAGITVGHWLLNMHSPVEQVEAVQAARTVLEALQESGAAEAQVGVGEAALTTATDALNASQNAGRSDAFKVSAILGILMGIFCFTLPNTPPAKNAKESNAAWEAIREVRRQPLVTLFFLAVPISVIHQFYFVHASQFLTQIQNRSGGEQLAQAINKILGVGGGGLMTIGQMTEIAVLALIPLFAKKVSRKTLLGLGIVAYALRMALFAYLPDIATALSVSQISIAIVGVALHGFCFGCFIFVAFMVVDEETTSDVRASAQNLFNLVIVGIGIIVGSWFATSIVGNWAIEVVDQNAEGIDITETNYTKLFSVPMWIAVGCLIGLLAFYPRRKPSEVVEPTPDMQKDDAAT